MHVKHYNLMNFIRAHEMCHWGHDQKCTSAFTQSVIIWPDLCVCVNSSDHKKDPWIYRHSSEQEVTTDELNMSYIHPLTSFQSVHQIASVCMSVRDLQRLEHVSDSDAPHGLTVMFLMMMMERHLMRLVVLVKSEVIGIILRIISTTDQQ